MSFIGRAIGDVVGGITGATAQAEGARDAAATQAGAAQLGIDEQRRQFDALQQMLAPYRDAGSDALGGQRDLIGMNGSGAQAGAIGGIQNGAEFQSLLRAGNENMLANASATGGLRGGNMQGALAQFSPQLLSQLINQQYSRLGGMTSIGQNAAAGIGNAGMQTGGNVANLLQQQGAATAGGQLAMGGRDRVAFGDALKLGSAYFGGGGGF